MSQPELVILAQKVTDALDGIGIGYMISGSTASSAQGEPRLSHDLDIVVSMRPDQVKKLIAVFPESQFYVSEEAIYDAVKRKAMFNILPLVEREKLDFWLLKDDPYDQMRFSRRYKVNIGGVQLNISRPEDTILYKLRWAMDGGGSEKQFHDALRVYEVQFKRLDMNYMDQWAEYLKVTDHLKQIRKEAQPIV